MVSKRMTGDVPRRWLGWRVDGPKFACEVIITRRRPVVGDDPSRDCWQHGYTYRTGSAGCPACQDDEGTKP